MGRRDPDDYLAGEADDPQPSDRPVSGWLQHADDTRPEKKKVERKPPEK